MGIFGRHLHPSFTTSGLTPALRTKFQAPTAPTPTAPVRVVFDHTPSPILAAVLSLFLWFAFSRAIELVPIRGLLAVLGAMLLGYSFITSRWTGAMLNIPTRVLLIFSALMIPSAIFGLWPGGSVKLIVNIWSRSALIYFVVVSFVQDAKTMRRVMGVFALAGTTLVLMGVFLRVDNQGRMAINTATLLNPNDLATLLVVSLPFAVYYLFDSQRHKGLRLLMMPTIAGLLFIILRTGSRAAFVSIAALSVVLLFTTRGRARFLLIFAGLMIGMGTALVLPSEMLLRYRTIFSSNLQEPDGSRQLEEATSSSAARWKLFLISLQVTLHNPFFGVGPGNFGLAAAEITSEDGGRATWQETHNSYTQVSSECGIPAGVLFLVLVVYSLRNAYRIRKLASASPDSQSLARMAFCIFAALVGWAVCATFGCVAYLIHLPLLAAMTVALKTIYASQVAQNASVAPKPAR